ncbi:helix-turn-helix domain-containing protein [Clostridium saudiense]|uniref:helix-turn-helix domain-containing protein n=1 Tax=Clostridium saudiense TaxID=1414720 RepID=UPI0018AAD21B|nr:helix-turn-helix transcriptional regulator [Clostridium saudiense]
MNELLIKLGNLIRTNRKYKKYSTKELADKLQVSSGLINNIENAKTDSFNLTLLNNLSTTLEIDMIDFISLNLNNSNLLSSNFSIDNKNIEDKYIAISSQLNSLVFSNKLDDNTVIILLDKLLIELNYFDSLKKYNK